MSDAELSLGKQMAVEAGIFVNTYGQTKMPLFDYSPMTESQAKEAIDTFLSERPLLRAYLDGQRLLT